MREEVQRRVYYGGILTWFGVDITNSVAQFESSFGPVPKKTMSEGTEYDSVNEYFESLPQITESSLLEEYQKKEEKHQEELNRPIKLYENFHKVSRRGLYTFYEEQDTNNYKIISLPQREFKVDELTEQIQDYLKDFVFHNIIFGEVEKLDITKYFECVGVVDSKPSSADFLWKFFNIH